MPSIRDVSAERLERLASNIDEVVVAVADKLRRSHHSPWRIAAFRHRMDRLIMQKFGNLDTEIDEIEDWVGISSEKKSGTGAYIALLDDAVKCHESATLIVERSQSALTEILAAAEAKKEVTYD